jgi:VIT1/CCC1 family predicted Fe2+/Mn2+ transporter/rubrerythrin
VTPAERATSLANLGLERDAIILYDGLAAIEDDPHRAAAFRTIAGNERRHAEIWARKLTEEGLQVPAPPGRARARIRLILLLARVFGTRAVADLVRSLEGDEEESYGDQDGPEVAAIAADEREHAQIWRRLEGGDDEDAAHREVTAAAASGARAAGRATAGDGATGRDEGWHRAGRSGTLRAAIFGVNDGLVSNLSLVMGVTGAAAQNEVVVLAGLAGLLAGAFSMGAGEWISMQSQRELFERQIAIEREELKIMPAEEEQELAAIYRRKGLPAADARRVAGHLMNDPQAALDTKVREELGLDPDELGSPWGAAFGSFVSFAVGALVPLAPFLVTRGSPAHVLSLGASFLALFVVGVGVSLLTGRSAVFSGLRQVLIGAAAALVTYLVGSLIGVQVAG